MNIPANTIFVLIIGLILLSTIEATTKKIREKRRRKPNPPSDGNNIENERVIPVRPPPAYQPCSCAATLAPVCAADGNTYTNLCILKCASVGKLENARNKVIVAGVCPKLKCNCDLKIDYVCGSDEFTYINECYLNCYSDWLDEFNFTTIRLAYRNKCKRINICSNKLSPVCGSDSRSYRNLCFLHYASQQNIRNDLRPIYLASWGECLSERCLCARIWNPICGSDGKEYSNYCEFKCEQRKRKQLDKTSLTIANRGSCNDCSCTSIYDPVCGSDDKSYRNPCSMACENRKRNIRGMAPVQQVKKGICECVCWDALNPVCASDGLTYLSHCNLDCANKERVLQGLPALFELKLSECVPCTCPRFTDPVCSSDGRSFVNSCVLECENKRRERFGSNSLTYTRGACPHIGGTSDE